MNAGERVFVLSTCMLHKAIPGIEVGDADRLSSSDWSLTIAEKSLVCMLRTIELSSTAVDSA